MADETFGMLLTSVANRDDANRIAELLIAERLAACVQTMPIESVYRWEGKIAHEAELLLLIKTRTALFAPAIAAIRKVHPYATPEIVGTAFAAGLADYFAWIATETEAGRAAGPP